MTKRKIESLDLVEDKEWTIYSPVSTGRKTDFIVYFDECMVAANIHSQIVSMFSVYFEKLFEHDEFTYRITIEKGAFKNLNLDQIKCFFEIIYNLNPEIKIEDLRNVMLMSDYFNCTSKFTSYIQSKIMDMKPADKTLKEYLQVISISKKYKFDSLGEQWFNSMKVNINVTWEDINTVETYVSKETIYAFFFGFLNYRKEKLKPVDYRNYSATSAKIADYVPSYKNFNMI